MTPIPTPASTKALINQELKVLFSERKQQAAVISPHYEELWKMLEKISLAGGKRLRPHLTIVAYKAFGGKDSKIATHAALAQELVHISLLIHDDIIDRDLTRHGQPNMTGQFLDSYVAFLPDAKERRHYAESAAMLGGDLLMGEAYNQVALAGKKELHKALFEVIGGQLLDTEGAFRPEPTDPMTIARYKTASYSFVGPLTTGAALAGASKAQEAILASFAEVLGIGYQLRDDLIGTFGKEEKTGKSVNGDIREGKRTFLIAAFHKQAGHAKDTFNQLFGNRNATDDEVDTIRTLLEKTGARRAVEDQIDDLKKKALKYLAKLEISPDYQQVFEEMIEASLYRDH